MHVCLVFIEFCTKHFFVPINMRRVNGRNRRRNVCRCSCNCPFICPETTIGMCQFYILHVHGSVHLKNILLYIQQDATWHIYLQTALHVSGGTSTHHRERKTNVSTASGICHTAIAAGSSNTMTNTRCCRYICLRFWWWVEVPPETCRAVSR